MTEKLNNNADTRRVFLTVGKALTKKSEKELLELMNSGKPVMIKQKVRLCWNNGLEFRT